MLSDSNYSIRQFSILIQKFIKFIGFGTFSVKNDKAYVTVFDFAFLIFNLLLASFVFYLSLTYGIERLSKRSTLLALGVIITMMCGSLVAIISMICVFCNRHRIWEVVVTLDTVISKFRKIHVYRIFKPYAMLATFGVVTVILILLGLLFMATVSGYYNKLIYLVIYGYLSTSFSVMIGWSSLIHLAIYNRLNLINQTIR